MKTVSQPLFLAILLITSTDEPSAQPFGGGDQIFNHPQHPLDLALDLDSDRTLNQEEIKRASRSLLQMDKNGNDRLEQNEYEPFVPANVGRMRPPPHPIADALDTNCDRIIDRLEIEAAERVLAPLDRDGDGAISQREMHEQALRMTGGRPGAQNPAPNRIPPGFNHASTTSKNSATARSATNAEAVERFISLDGNQDGTITSYEVPARLGDLMRADTDGYGKGTRGEARRFVEKLHPSGAQTRRGF